MSVLLKHIVLPYTSHVSRIVIYIVICHVAEYRLQISTRVTEDHTGISDRPLRMASAVTYVSLGFYQQSKSYDEVLVAGTAKRTLQRQSALAMFYLCFASTAVSRRTSEHMPCICWSCPHQAAGVSPEGPPGGRHASYSFSLSALSRVYHSLCPHPHGITAAAVPITTELPQQLSPFPR